MADTVAPRPERVREGLRLSPNEERYVLAETLTGQVYAVPAGARFKGPLQFDKLLTALQETCDRHEARRAGYERSPDGAFTKYVEARATVHLERLSMPGASDAAVIEAINAYAMRKGDLSPGELHRFILIELGPNDHVFAFALHHATSDGVAFGAFVMEVYARLLGFPLPEAPGQYSDFWNFDWTASDGYREAEAFWKARLGDIGDPGAWPADRPRGHSQVRLGEMAILSPDMVARTRAAAAEIGVTPFTYFYAVYLVLLSRMIGSETVVTTFQSAGRKGFPGAERTAGVFSNSLIVATGVDPAASVATIARKLRGDVKSAIAHEIYPYHHAIRATGVRARYAMNWMPPLGGVITFDDIQIIPLLLHQNQDDDDLNLRFGEYDGEFRLTLYYDPSAYEAGRVAAAARQLALLADELARDVNRPVGEVRSANLSSGGVLPDLDQPLPAPGSARIFDAFLARAAETPEAVAVSQAGVDYSYGEVERRSFHLARRLRKAGLQSGDRLAIVADRGPELVWSMIAAARAGLRFAVLDAAHPEPRLADLTAVLAPTAVVWAGAGEARLAARLAGLLPLLEAGVDGDVEGDISGLDDARPGDVAYVVFTSGTTGRPKAVAASHAPLSDFIAWHISTHGLHAGDRFALLSGLAHDPMLRDVFTPLSLGATLCIPDGVTLTEAGALGPWIGAVGVTVVHLTPQMGRLATTAALPALRWVFWGGDRLSREQVAEMARRAPAAKQVAFYGTTETPQAVAACPVDAGMTSETAPLGQGVGGAQLLVLDDAGRLLGVGELGEIAVRSSRLAIGHIEAGRLVASAEPQLFRTGDLGLHLPDGSVMFVSRRDDQVKVRGRRVEPAEIAAALRAREGVREAVVLPVGEGDRLWLAAFVVGRGLDGNDLKAALAARLPAYMVPTQIVVLERLPLTPNGKTDRDALRAHLKPAPEQAAPTHDRPPNAGERQLIDAWAAVLGDRELSPGSTFAAAGGDSLSYVQGYLALQEVIGDPPGGWPLMTVAELAAARPNSIPAEAAGREVDSAIALRAGAIALVVAEHYRLLPSGLGATGVLMLISGFLFGGMGLSEVFRTGSARPAFTVLRNIVLPVAVMGVAIWLFRLPGEQPPQLYILLMTADLQDWRITPPQDLPLWFVHALVHILAFVALAAAGLRALGRLDVGRQRFLWGLFVIGCLGRFVAPALLDPNFLRWGIDAADRVNYLPTTHLATFALGGLVACAETPTARRRLAPVILGYALLSAPFYGPGQAAFVLAGGALLTFRPSLRVPHMAGHGLLAIAGASLWIYLTHMLLRDALGQVGFALPPGVDLATALLLGIAVARAWAVAVDGLRRLAGRRAATADAVV